MKKRKDYLAVITMLLLCISSIAGILSMNFSHTFDYVNQYGHTVSLFGYGIYARDSYFKAPISIGTDFCILFVLIPMFLYTYYRYRKAKDSITELKLASVYAVAAYYGASMAFGVTYNRLVLVYIFLFSASLFGMFMHIVNLQLKECATITKGIKWFLGIGGVALIVAWLPDIIPTLITGKTLPLIGNCTTEITYVLDMGIISPACFVTIYLLQKKKPLGTVMLAILLKANIFVGIMMIPQTICQILSGVDIAFPVLVTKSLSFLILGGFAFWLNLKLYWEIEESPFHRAFCEEINQKLQERQSVEEVCLDEEIAMLPKPMQKYCAYIGLEGFQKCKASRTFFKETDFLFNIQTMQRLKMDYDLWLFNGEPDRQAYCSSSLHGVPFDGIDYCEAGKYGGMKGILGKRKQIFDEKNEQGYVAEMISWIAESAALNPAGLLSKYISYESIDETHVKATISINGISGCGIFTFDKDGAILKFYSDERQVEKINGVMTPVGWYCLYQDYKQCGNIKAMQKLKVVKVLPDREVVYFASDDFHTEYRI